ncbi:hypothetical protein [Vreelandella maris]|uniref:hypothetical protein n=1 Tax=Vreelandella maris TaxID=2729617 RepID=UPI0030ECA1DE
MHRDIEKKRDVTLAQVKRALPNVPLPRKPSAELMATLGYPYILPAPRPSGDVVTQGESEERDGQWYQTWIVRDYTDAERAEQLERRRADKLREINDQYTAAASPLIKEYPEVEQKSWDQQKADAEAYLVWHETQQGEPPQMMVLDNILAGRNGEDGTETLYELCLAVRRNAQAFAEFQLLTGKRQRLAKLVRAAEGVEGVGSINW